MSTSSRSEQESQERSGVTFWDLLQPTGVLRPYFLALAAQVRKWASDHSSPVKIGITSLKDRAGKSTISLYLAASLARTQTQKILLIDANLGHPFLSDEAEKRLGFTDFLIGNVDLQDCALRHDALNLDVLVRGTIRAGNKSALPLELLGTIVEDQMVSYDFIVFDLPTVSQSPAFLSMTSQMDGIILVVEGMRREQAAISKLNSILSRSGTRLIGLVVNKGV